MTDYYLVELKTRGIPSYRVREDEGKFEAVPRIALRSNRTEGRTHILNLIAAYSRLSGKTLGRLKVEPPRLRSHAITQVTSGPLTVITPDLRIYANLGHYDNRNKGYQRLSRLLDDIKTGKIKVKSSELTDKLGSLEVDEFLDLKLALAMNDTSLYRTARRRRNNLPKDS